MLNKKALAGTPSTPPVYVEDVFSTYLYTGNGSSQTITNGIDLSTKGGLVWIKDRLSADYDHTLYDTVRGLASLNSNATRAQQTYPSGYEVDPFNNNGFTVNSAYNQAVNRPTNYVSWSFRKQAKFFDIVTWTGNGSAAQTISHNLGSTPGFIITKKTSSTSAWYSYHRGLDNANQKGIRLNLTNAPVNIGVDIWNPTSTTFQADSNLGLCDSGDTYVAYLFAHNASGFGAAGTDNVISCGSFTTDGSGSATVSLGYEPQWVLIKQTTGTGNWFVIDNMRNFSQTVTAALQPNLANAEIGGFGDSTYQFFPTATGFQSVQDLGVNLTYIYMAIRRPMKTPTSGTEVFVTDAAGANASANGEVFSSTFPVDFHFRKERSSAGNNWFTNSRLIPGSSLRLNLTNAESTLAYVDKYDRMSGIATTTGFNYTDWAGWLFKRATGFFDMVCYTGTGSATTVTHNLGVAPELMIVKQRNTSGSWAVYHSALGNTKWIRLNDNYAASTASTIWNDTSPTSSVFTVGTSGTVNGSSNTYVAYLFATLAGISKVGSYTGTGSAQTINCGFSAGARFVLIRRTDDWDGGNPSGDWYIYDTARGIVSGNDPFLLANTSTAQTTNTDYIDPANSGFEISSTAPDAINANGGSFIFLAIA